MWGFVLLVVGGITWGFWKLTHPGPAQLPGGNPQQLPPPGVGATSFGTIAIGTQHVAAFLPTTRDEMVKVLAANGWILHTLLAPDVSIFTMGPPGQFSGIDALSGMRAAALAGLNVFADADLALKLSGSAAAPPASGNPVFVAAAPGLPPIVPESGNEQTANTPQQAIDSLDPAFPGSRFVLFAQAHEQF